MVLYLFCQDFLPVIGYYRGFSMNGMFIDLDLHS
jgi:hypothetical protein